MSFSQSGSRQCDESNGDLPLPILPGTTGEDLPRFAGPLWPGPFIEIELRHRKSDFCHAASGMSPVQVALVAHSRCGNIKMLLDDYDTQPRMLYRDLAQAWRDAADRYAQTLCKSQTSSNTEADSYQSYIAQFRTRYQICNCDLSVREQLAIVHLPQDDRIALGFQQNYGARYTDPSTNSLPYELRRYNSQALTQWNFRDDISPELERRLTLPCFRPHALIKKGIAKQERLGLTELLRAIMEHESNHSNVRCSPSRNVVPPRVLMPQEAQCSERSQRSGPWAMRHSADKIELPTPVNNLQGSLERNAAEYRVQSPEQGLVIQPTQDLHHECNAGTVTSNGLITPQRSESDEVPAEVILPDRLVGQRWRYMPQLAGLPPRGLFDQPYDSTLREKRAQLLSIEDLDDYDLLTEGEGDFCILNRCTPTAYLSVKQNLFRLFHTFCEFDANGITLPGSYERWTRSQAQKCKGIDANKISRMYLFYREIGLFRRRWDVAPRSA